MSGVEVLPLGEVVKPTRPRVKPSDYPNLPFIGMEHVEAHSMKLLGTVPAATMKSSAVHFKPGDVLYGRLRPYLNKVCRPTFEGLCSAEFIVLPGNERVDSGYLQYFFNSSEFVRYASHLNTGDRPRVDFEQLAPYEIPLPDLGEQRRIVAEIEKQFSRLDEAVANLKRVKGNLARYRDQVLTAAVEGRLSHADEAGKAEAPGESAFRFLERVLRLRREGWDGRGRYCEPAPPPATGCGRVPDGWVLSTIEQLAWLDVGFAFRSAEFVGEGIRLLRGENIEPGSLRWEDVRYWAPSKLAGFEHLLLGEGQIVLAMDRPIITAGLKLARVKVSDLPCLLVQRMTRLRCVDRSVEPYLYIAMSTERFRRHLLGGQTGTQLPHVSGATIASFVVPLPPPDEQRRIVSEVDRRLSIVRELEAEVDTNLRRAQTFRQAVLTNFLAKAN